MTNKYDLSKHRFYELKHWCLQYPEWEALYNDIDGYCKQHGDTTSKDGILLAELYTKMALVRKVCQDTDADISEELLRTVTGKSIEIPSTSYIYKRFFWLLDKVKG